MKSFTEKYGPWALVTGASSGIGVEFAKRLAANGLNVILVARREDRLRSLAEELERDYSAKTRVVAVDLTRDDLLDSIRDATEGSCITRLQTLACRSCCSASEPHVQMSKSPSFRSSCDKSTG